ncbi:MAG: hypothetical protein AAFY72_09820, partial [Cyanobacteria bacterium J06649_4]
AVADVGVQGSTTGTPAPVTITNTVGVPVTTANQLDTITLLPLTQTEATDAADLLDDGTANGSAGTYGPTLPDGTIVTITHNGNSAEYTVVGGAYTLTNGATVVVGTITPGNTEDYTVQVQLPANTPQIQGFEVPIAAFVDNDSDSLFTPATESIANITVDRVYTGFMTLLKEFSLDGGATFVTTPDDAPPGADILYRISYQNISEAATGNTAGSILLNANNFTLIEDGNAGTNNWAGVTLHQNGTTATNGTVEYFNGAATLGTTDPVDETTGPSGVTVYRNAVGTVAPQATGSMTFTRQIQ